MVQYYYQGGKKIMMPDLGYGSDNGLTMVLSFWDDMATNMNWLDTGERGSCDTEAGDPATLRVKHPDARFDIRHMRWGPIGTTHASVAELLRAEELADVVV